MENKYYAPDISEFHVGFEFDWENQEITYQEIKSLHAKIC